MPRRDPDASARDVEARLAALAHPRGDAISELRAAVRAARPDATESWKWNAPSWSLRDHFATLALRRPDEVLLILHAGARPRVGLPPLRVADPAGLLRIAGPDRAIAGFRSADEVRAARPALEDAAREWAALLEAPPA
ncbi:hypothetical protein BFL36_10920 [Clavibacter michiganensis]|uniref:YdhG-like domain-containing protein n=1 Tax=Clavibacter michiganensis TaxID=28447 RepID=A0A251YC12_9MICO|nr:DUF1801 domain-containing protein [Clavibacter michiganensis]OUE21794.1 hypothetical protein BFL36_10920 [Clavibacter michiganensis]